MQDASLVILDGVMDSLKSLAEHDVGCAAFASLAASWVTKHGASGGANEQSVKENGADNTDATILNPEEACAGTNEDVQLPPLTKCWKRLFQLLDTNVAESAAIQAINKMAAVCLTLASNESR